jgi:hypothetical protein
MKRFVAFFAAFFNAAFQSRASPCRFCFGGDKDALCYGK